MRSIANLGCYMDSQIIVAHITLPKAVLNTVKIFAVYKYQTLFRKSISWKGNLEKLSQKLLPSYFMHESLTNEWLHEK